MISRGIARGISTGISPVGGAPLRPDTPHTLHDGERRWPVVEDIPWLRAGRDEVRERAVAALDAGDRDGATAVLLADADDWWDRPPPPQAQLRSAVGSRTLREAVGLLDLRRVGDYFLHRWSDPSWLALLALTAAHPPAGRPVLDLACGAGHLLRHLALHGHRDLLGVDVVFAKLWLARRFVLPRTVAPVALVCADLTAPWPLALPVEPVYVACHDALYFIDGKDRLVARALAHAGPMGAVVLGHCHNALHPAGRTGLPLDPDGWAGLLPGAAAYTEEELTDATVDGLLPRPAGPAALATTEALGLALDPARARPDVRLTAPAPGAALVPNPLYVDGVLQWPNERWAAEYGPRAAAYLPRTWAPSTSDAATRGRLRLDLPELW